MNDFISFDDILSQKRTRFVLENLIPVGAYISLPLPTNRWRVQSYAMFAAPALRRPGQPTVQTAPDRWLLFDARHGHLLAYNLMTVNPYAAVSFETVIVPQHGASVDSLRQSLSDLGALMNEAVIPSFFGADNAISFARKDAVRRLLVTVVPEPLFPLYRALTPDFFEWLERTN
jgi:hypothetical protein